MPISRASTPAGGYNTQFGVSSVSALPPLIAVELTSTYNTATGYSWIELRGSPGVGFAAPTFALTGNNAYDITGDTTLTVGTRCVMSIDRDQTTYLLWFPVSTSGGDGSGSGGSGGSGSGSGGDGCDAAVSPITFDCSTGTRTATITTLGIGRDGNQLVLTECETTTAELGPCSPVTPDGTTLPVATQVCPSPCGDAVGDVVIKLSTTDAPECFLPADGSDVSRTTYAALFAIYGVTFGPGDASTTFTLPDIADPVAGLSYFVRCGSPAPVVTRRLLTVPIAGDSGCIQFAEADCCGGSGSGSGSGSGPTSECTTDCQQCLTMSAVWTLAVTGYDPITLYHVENPNDGNGCRFNSLDLSWSLYYDSSAEAWFLVNYDTSLLWYILGPDFGCLIENFLISEDGGDGAVINPVYDCTDVSYNCTSGGCVSVAGTGGAYPTLEACLAACDSIATGCADCPTLPSILYFSTTPPQTPITVTITYNGSEWFGIRVPVTGPRQFWSFIATSCNVIASITEEGGGSASYYGTLTSGNCSPVDIVLHTPDFGTFVNITDTP